MRIARLLLVTPLVAVTVAGGLIAAVPAEAGGAPPAPFVVTPAGPRRAADATASVAGYVATLGSAARRTLVGTVVVPTVTCRTRTQSPLFITLGLFGNQAGGTEFDYASADLTVTCTQGVPYYQAAVSTNPDRQVGAVTPGDTLTARLTVSGGKAVATLTDVTTGGVFRSEGTAIVATAAQASVQGGFDGRSFPRFPAVRFAGVRIDGAALGTYSPTSFDQVDDDERVLLQTTALTSQQTFAVRFVAQP